MAKKKVRDKKWSKGAAFTEIKTNAIVGICTENQDKLPSGCCRIRKLLIQAR